MEWYSIHERQNCYIKVGMLFLRIYTPGLVIQNNSWCHFHKEAATTSASFYEWNNVFKWKRIRYDLYRIKFRKRTPFQGKLRLTHTAQFEYDLAWELMEDVESQSHESMTLRWWKLNPMWCLGSRLSGGHWITGTCLWKRVLMTALLWKQIGGSFSQLPSLFCDHPSNTLIRAKWMGAPDWGLHLQNCALQ